MEEAGILMELGPPTGWGDMATKRDLDYLESRLKDELAARLRGLFFAIAALFLGAVSLLLAAPHFF
ncbi:MAG: hypothetical protein ACR2FO_02650 [Actinomycetota bacterium]